MADISAAVGHGGANKDADVLTVQVLLNQVPVTQGGATPVMDLDGWCGHNTIAAITAFQKKQFGTGDGRVDPGKKTIEALKRLASAPGARPVPLPDVDPSEMATRSIPQALTWANAALNAIAELEKGSTDAVFRTALQSHFKITPSDTHLLAIVKDNFTKAVASLNRGKAAYQSVSRKQMEIDLGPHKDAPGYTMPATHIIRWTPLFHARTSGPRPGMQWTGDGFGPMCRAAMVLHEPIHAVDAHADFDVYEWGPEYTSMNAQRSVHNASSYPSFAAHVSERSTDPMGPRYGAGRAAD
jgi:hypothetical protein